MDAFLIVLVFLNATWQVYWIPLLLCDLVDPRLYLDFLNLPYDSDFDTEMSTRKCCVPKCTLPRTDDNILHIFPNPNKDLPRYKMWTYAIGGKVMFEDPETVFKNLRVCHSHFEPKYHMQSKRLSPNAIPTLNVRGYSFLSRKQPKQDHSNLDVMQKVPAVASASEPTLVPTTVKSYSTLSTECLRRQPMTDISNFDISQTKALLSSELTLPSTSATTVPTLSSVYSKNNKFKKYPSQILALRRLIKKLKNSKENYKNKLKRALRLTANATFNNVLKKFTSLATVFTMLQFREIKKKKMGRRFTKEEKVMALALYKQGPKAYRWMRKFFVLPSPITLSRMITKASIKPGINENIFAQLKKKVDKMKTNERLCILLFDEMAVMPHFDFNRRMDEFTGYVTNGESCKEDIADHALVFMIRGLHKNYKQPLAYMFCANSTPKIELAVFIKTIISKLHSIGLKVIATVCDQGSNNVSAVNYLIDETKKIYLRKQLELKRKVFEVDGEEVIPIYDPPHLIKGMRNNLLTKNLKYTMKGEEKIAKWEHVIRLYNENPAYQGIRLMPKLTERHVVASKISKMKVKLATQVFSRTVAVNMGYLSRIGQLPSDCQNTADLLLFFDNLFDSVNGSYDNYKKRHGKPLLGPVTRGSPHMKFWREAKDILKTMIFISNEKNIVVPSIKNWLQTIENIEYVIDILSEKYNITSVWLRHFNQDPLENFFGGIRSHGCRNVSPTCAGFRAAFASLLINNLGNMHSAGANCEVDSCVIFKSLKDIFFKDYGTDSQSAITDVNFDHIDTNNVFIDFNEKISNPKIKNQIEYVTGYLLKKLNIQCKKCLECLSDTEGNALQTLISLKEYLKNKCLLKYPTQALVKCFSQIQDIVNIILKENITRKNVKEYTKTILTIVIDYSFIKCNEHKADLIKKIEEILINLFFYNWCKDTNKLLCGSRSDFDVNDKIQLKSYEYYKKKFNKKRK